MRHLFLTALAATLLIPSQSYAAENYEDFLELKCENINEKENQDKFKKLDYRSFSDWYLKGFQERHPNYKVEEFKQYNLNYKAPDDASAKDMEPFLWLVIGACVEEDWKQETLGQSLEKATLGWFEDHPEYINKSAEDKE